MRLRLDLRKRPDPAQPGHAMMERTIITPRPFGHADCGQWFPFASQLIEHVKDCQGQVEWDG